jgi:hypothetical protein
MADSAIVLKPAVRVVMLLDFSSDIVDGVSVLVCKCKIENDKMVSCSIHGAQVKAYLPRSNMCGAPSIVKKILRSILTKNLAGSVTLVSLDTRAREEALRARESERFGRVGG